MRKEELKSLAKEMYYNLLNSIDEQDEATIQQVINHLYEAIDIIKQVKEDDVNSLENAKAVFHNAYKDIAEESLMFYETTNLRFEELTSMQNSAIEECSTTEHIDIPKITEKFLEIQFHMLEEVKKANETISQLTSQIKALEKKSNIDSLTKVYNRRALDAYLNMICQKDDVPYELHLLMLDLDNFKHLNDTYGHIAGDKTLIFVSNILKRTLRDGDKIFRYGGEEFVIILNRIDDKLCQKIANRILELIRKNKLIYKGESLEVTASIGATRFYENDTPESILDRADKALYIAKEAGKDQIAVTKGEDGV